MYSIWSDGACIHNDAYLPKGYKVLSPKLTMEDNAAGSLVMTLPPVNVGYSSVRRLTSEIVVKRDGTEIWSGRVIDEKQGFHNSRVLTCEGELAYLNDTIQPPREYQGYTVRGLLEAMIALHNSMSDKKFTVGSVTVTDLDEDNYRYTNYETTLDYIKSALIGEHGGHIRVRKVGTTRYLDYLADWANTNSQVIRFGTNLLDFTRTWDMTQLVTAIIPRGARLSDVFDYDHTVTAVLIQRGHSSDKYTKPTRWYTNEVYAAGYYMWQRVRMTLRNGVIEYTEPDIIVSPPVQDKDEKDNKKDKDKKEAPTVKTVTSEYYLSTNRSSRTGGEWGLTIPKFKEGCSYYCRGEITWSDGSTTYTKEIHPESAAEDTNPHPDDYLTIASVNNQDIYIRNEEAVAAYGWIARTVDFDDVVKPENLLTRGRAWLADSQFEKLVLELTAIDLRYLNPDAEAIKPLDQIRCVSVPHGMDRYFPVTKMEIPLDKPEETTYILGLELKVSLSSATARAQASANIASSKASSASASARQSFTVLTANQRKILEEAKDNASSLINQAVNGYITVVQGANNSEELIISDSPDYTGANRLWRWNINGLGYSKDGGETYGLAMTMDGAIVADFITAGTLNAGVIKAGTIRDAAGSNYWNLETGEFQLSANTKVGDSTVITASDVSARITNETKATVVAADVEYGNSDNETTAPSLWTTKKADWKQGKYLWTRIKMTLKDNSIQYSDARLIAGGDGLGVSSVTEQYYLSNSNTTQSKGSWVDTQPDWIDGYYYWTRSEIKWSDGTTTFTKPVLASALTSGNQSTSTLDKALTQEEIFNRLTNNGQTQGIYLQNGKLYINATYIASGKITSVSGNNYWDLNSGQFHFDTGNHIILDEYGLWISDNEGRRIGNTIMLYDSNNPDTIHGWGFDLEHSGDFLTWAVQDNEKGLYYYKLLYPRVSIWDGTDEGVSQNAFNFYCNIDMHGWAIKNAYIEGY